MPEKFKDHFSEQSAIYARSRPGYPDELYQFLFHQVRSFGKAWDCATGNGQVAIHLAERFEKVIATDASAGQLEHARPHERIIYEQANAEDPDIEVNSIDLITVGTAVHWFDQERFYSAVDKVLKRGGILAVWSYNHMQVSEELDVIMDVFTERTMEPYWPEEAKRNFRGKYQDIELPYPEINAPEFEMKVEWGLMQLYDYIHSWSASKNYKAQHDEVSLNLIKTELETAWGDPERKRRICWPLNMRVCRKQ